MRTVSTVPVHIVFHNKFKAIKSEVHAFVSKIYKQSFCTESTQFRGPLSVWREVLQPVYWHRILHSTESLLEFVYCTCILHLLYEQRETNKILIFNKNIDLATGLPLSGGRGVAHDLSVFYVLIEPSTENQSFV